MKTGEKFLRFLAFLASLLSVLIGLIHIIGWTYDIAVYLGLGQLDTDTYTSVNKVLTRMIEGLGIVAFGITGLLLSEQRRNEEADEEFKRTQLTLLEKIINNQDIHKQFNQEELGKIQKSIHTIKSQNGKKGKRG